jgi:hypothetical protein
VTLWKGLDVAEFESHRRLSSVAAIKLVKCYIPFLNKNNVGVECIYLEIYIEIENWELLSRVPALG